MLKKYIIAFLIAMVPIVELRGALPIALASGLPTLPAYVTCIIGNMLPVPFIYFFAQGILNWGQDKPLIGGFCRWCIRKGERAGEKLQSSAGMGMYIALLLFVGVPLPGTGAWTGTFAASILHMDFKRSVVAVMAGVLLAGIIMGTLTLLGIRAFT